MELPSQCIRIVGLRWRYGPPVLTLTPFAAVVFPDSETSERDLIQMTAELFMPTSVPDRNFTGRSSAELNVAEIMNWHDEFTTILTPGAGFDTGSYDGCISLDFRNIEGDVLVKGTIAEYSSEWTQQQDQKRYDVIRRSDWHYLSRLDFCFILDPSAVTSLREDLAKLLENAAAVRRASIK